MESATEHPPYPTSLPAPSPGMPRPNVADTGLSAVYEPEDIDPVIDIIFIHGLQGHPLKTWSCGLDRSHSLSQATQSPRGSQMENNSQLPSRFQRLFSHTKSFKHGSTSLLDEPAPSAFWPGDFVPEDFPDARVLVFGYNTLVAKTHFAGAANKNSLFGHSRDLMNELCRTRPLRRPIIFVTHSLGGILVKETLSICSTSNNRAFEDILNSTAGVIFMGTPHRGSSAAGIGEIARKVASVLLMDTNARILDSLSLKNSDLERCQEIFSALWQKHNFCVKTFQEGLPLKLPLGLGQYKKAKVVPDISSCIGDSRERVEILDGDHRSICRFPCRWDRNYIKVAAELRQIRLCFLASTRTRPLASSESASEVPKVESQQLCHPDDEGKIEDLKFPEMHLRQLVITMPATDTCEWLFETTLFKSWIDRVHVEDHFGLIQIVGNPGSGKSTLMKNTFETVRAHPRSAHVVGHFFDRRGQALEHSAEGMFRSILHQLCTLHPKSAGTFWQYTRIELESLKSKRPAYREALQAGLSRIFSNKLLAPERSIIFLDALDECDQTEAAWVGYFFAELVREAHKAKIRLDVCISRRGYPIFTVGNCLEVRMEDHNREDIEHYISRKLELASVPLEQSVEIRQIISQRSNGIFLWVVLAVEGALKDIESGKNVKHVLKRVQSLPKALELLFAQLLEDIEAEELGMTLLLFQWAVLARGCLRIHEWHHILAFLRGKPPRSLSQWQESEYYTETDSQLERQIKNYSRGLIEIKGNAHGIEEPCDAASFVAGAGSLDSTTGDSRVVQLVHESVALFFVSGRSNALFNKDTSYNFVGEGHLAIMRVCINYINISELDDLATARRHLAYASSTSKEIRPQSMNIWETKGPIKGKGNAVFVSSMPEMRPAGRQQNWASPMLRHKSSMTSFMSSASSHQSAPYQYNSDQKKKHDNSSRSKNKPSRHKEILGLKRSKSQSVPQPHFPIVRESTEAPNPSDSDGSDIDDDSDSSDWEDSTDDDPDSSDWEDSIGARTWLTRRMEAAFGSRPKDSIKSQVLERHPSLASYALSHAYQHAQEAWACKVDPTKDILKLHLNDGWTRWSCLKDEEDIRRSPWKDLISEISKAKMETCL